MAYKSSLSIVRHPLSTSPSPTSRFRFPHSNGACEPWDAPSERDRRRQTPLGTTHRTRPDRTPLETSDSFPSTGRRPADRRRDRRSDLGRPRRATRPRSTASATPTPDVPTAGPRPARRPRCHAPSRSGAPWRLPHATPTGRRTTARPLEARADPGDRPGRRDRRGQEPRSPRAWPSSGRSCIDADTVGHALLDQRPVRERVVARFGPAGPRARRPTTGGPPADRPPAPWGRSCSPTRRRGRRWRRSSTPGCGGRSRRRSPGSIRRGQAHGRRARRRDPATRPAGTRSATASCSSTPRARPGSPGSRRARGWDDDGAGRPREGPVAARSRSGGGPTPWSSNAGGLDALDAEVDRAWAAISRRAPAAPPRAGPEPASRRPPAPRPPGPRPADRREPADARTAVAPV